MMNLLVCIILLLLAVHLFYLVRQDMNMSSRRRGRGEGFAYQPMAVSNDVSPYKCYQNNYRPHVITEFGTYATEECQEMLCKD